MLIFLPPVGIVLLWTQRKYPVVVRILLSLLFGILFIVGVVSMQDSGVDSPSERAATATPAPISAKATAKPVTDSQKTTSKGFQAGMYKVGADMPAGEYKLFCTDTFLGLAYFEIAKDSAGTLDSIVANDNFGGFTYVTVSSGQYLTLERCYALPVAEASPYSSTGGKYGEGMYKVGYDIPAGEYRVQPDGDSSLGFGYLEVCTDSRHKLDSIVSNDNFEDPRYVTVSRGQYLKLSSAFIER